MTGPIGSVPAATGTDARIELRRLARELEGVFVAQLFAAMRASAASGAGGEASGQALFTSLLDERLAGETAQRMRSSVGEALYRQLCRRHGLDAPPHAGAVEGRR